MAQIQVRPEEKVVITRIFDAPRGRVWRAWTEPDHLRRWWGPKGYTAPVARVDLRVGGEYFSCMRSPEGKDICGKGTFKEVTAPERLVVTDSFADEKGNIVSAAYYGMNPDWPRELLITVALEEVGGKTRMTLTHSGLEGVSEQDREDMRHGWEESFDKLAQYLKEM